MIYKTILFLFYSLFSVGSVRVCSQQHFLSFTPFTSVCRLLTGSRKHHGVFSCCYFFAIFPSVFNERVRVLRGITRFYWQTPVPEPDRIIIRYNLALVQLVLAVRTFVSGFRVFCRYPKNFLKSRFAKGRAQMKFDISSQRIRNIYM